MSTPPESSPDAPEPNSGEGPSAFASLHSLLYRCIQGIEQGRPEVTDKVCAERPDLAEDLRRRIHDLHSVGFLGEQHDARPVDSANLRSEGGADAPVGTSEGRYLIGEQIGIGGVGTVFRARDLAIGRNVAMKFLHDHHRHDRELSRRFLEEAQVCGQLQHPGIVPVHDLGTLSGQAFFAMRLITGRTFAEVLAARHGTALHGESRPNAADDLQRHVATFVHVCNAVAFAHARCVVHRDLKPANVMIGEFGEVQVVDWGLAKILGGDKSDAASAPTTSVDPDAPRNPVSVEHPAASITGSVFGTPSYMSPEQARGDVEHVDRRSDVFALGAMLCEILTGQPAYESPLKDRAQRQAALIAMASAGQLEPARHRLHNCSAPPALVRLALHCLQPDACDRPADAGLVAQAMDSHLRATEQRAREAAVQIQTARQRQRFLFAFIALVVVALAVATVQWQATEEQRDVAQGRLDQFRVLANGVKLRQAIASEHALYPSHEATIESLKAWLAESAHLTEQLPKLRGALEKLTQRSSVEGSDDLIFASVQDEFLHEQLRELIANLSNFTTPETGLHATVTERLAWAEQLKQLTITDHQAAWDRARTAIAEANGSTASKLYGAHAVDLQPVAGLIPIGMNPVSKLWEFYHPETAADRHAAIPQHDPTTGQIAVDGDMGLVFVLIPGGSFMMGSQSDDETASNYDAAASIQEKPVHRVELSPFFMSRYEMTQGQWQRVRGPHTCGYQVGTNPGKVTVTLANPVESVSWLACVETMRRLGTRLPTSAQWEHACRGGTTKPYYTGVAFDSLKGHENIADEASRRWYRKGWQYAPDWADGHGAHAPVGSFSPNPFGLHDMAGNVREWCQDSCSGTTEEYTFPVRAGDGLRLRGEAKLRVARGGSFTTRGAASRSASSVHNPESFHDAALGLRITIPLAEPQ